MPAARYSGQIHQIDRDAVGPSFAPLLALMSRTVKRAEAFKNGSLLLVFNEGDVLAVDADPNYEPWNIAGENGLRVVSVPGGDLAIWLPAESTHE